MTDSLDDPSPDRAESALAAATTARALRNLGRVDRAIAKYDEALVHRPEFVEILDELLDLLESIGDVVGVADRCARWIERLPDHATHDAADRIHSRRVDALCRVGGLDLAFAAYGLEPVARTDVEIGRDETVAVVGLRDEVGRLPAFLDHHRRLGIDRFLVVDDDSSDGSLEFLARQPDVALWHTAGSYRGANCGAVWWDLMVRRYVRGNWTLIVDADEHFLFPDCETRAIASLCEELDEAGASAYRAILLDLYPEGPLSEAVIEPGHDPLTVLRWFDRDWYRVRRPFVGPRNDQVNHWGGVRARIFGDDSIGSYLLDKIPLLRPRDGEVFMSGMHWIDRDADEISGGRGVLAHLKYDSTFAALVEREADRGEHAGGARVHRHIAGRLTPDQRFFDAMQSVRFEDTGRLVHFGIMRTTIPDGSPASAVGLVAIPGIPAVPAGIERPLLSVVLLPSATRTGVPLSDRVAEVRSALAGGPSAEILVVATPGTRIPGGGLGPGAVPVHVVATADHLTEIGAANLGIANAVGRWVHVLTHGWSLAPDMHDRLPDDEGPLAILVDADAFGPTGVALAIDPALELAQLTVRRDLLTADGGIATTIPAAAPWELVQRITAGDDTRLGPMPSPARTDRTRPTRAVALRYGEDVAQRNLAITVVGHRLGLDESVVRACHDACALGAIATIDADIRAGRFTSALATVARLHRSSISPEVRDALSAAAARNLP